MIWLCYVPTHQQLIIKVFSADKYLLLKFHLFAVSPFRYTF